MCTLGLIVLGRIRGARPEEFWTHEFAPFDGAYDAPGGTPIPDAAVQRWADLDSRGAVTSRWVLLQEANVIENIVSRVRYGIPGHRNVATVEQVHRSAQDAVAAGWIRWRVVGWDKWE